MLEGKIPRYSNNGNQDILWLSRPQQKVTTLHTSGFDAVTKGNEDVNAQFTFLCIIYTHYDQKVASYSQEIRNILG